MWEICSTCKRHLPLWAFHRRRSQDLAIQTRCKSCVKNSRAGIKSSNPRGRPKGHRLSKESRAKIAASRTGQYHDKVTKDKISHSVARYHKENFSPHSDELKELYGDVDGFSEWYKQNKGAYDYSPDYYTEKQIDGKSRWAEIGLDSWLDGVRKTDDFLDAVSVEDLDPEKILLLHEYMEREGSSV